MPNQSTDHIERGLEKRLGQDRDDDVLEALLTSYLRRTQRVEDMAWDVASKLNIASGTGWILDAIGRIVGRGRAAYASDAVYRIALYAQIAINRSRGRVADIVEVGRLSYGTVTVRDYPPASYTATLAEAIDGPSSVPFLENMSAVRPLGVRGFGIVSTTPMVTSARWGSVLDPTIGTDAGTVTDGSVGAPAPHTRDL